LKTTRFEVVLQGPKLTGASRVAYRDENYAGRIGWKEIVVGNTPSSSDELRAYPKDLLSSPLAVTAVQTRLVPGTVPGTRPHVTHGTALQARDRIADSRFAALVGRDHLGAWVILASLTVCIGTWFVIERTRLGAYLRAATENPTLVRAFGINVPRMITLTYGFGVALAAVAGVMAAPIYNVSPQMGSDLIIVVFAVVVIGGMGSIMGAIVTGFGLGIIEGLTKVFYPEASNTVIFVIMAIVLLIRPAGLFGRTA